MAGAVLLRGFRAVPLLRRPVEASLLQRASIVSKPAKGKVGPIETVIGLSAFVIAFMVPSGWILTHLENYKKRESEQD